MLTPLLAYQAFILANLLVLLGIVVVNLRTLPSIADYDKAGSDTGHKAAILVPARNEEANIEACLLGLLSQDYPNYEVWLYNDASTDRTGEIAARVAATHPNGARLYIVNGNADPPPGWLGKANACHRLYEAMRAQSSPDYILFTDADVRHGPGTLHKAVAAAQAAGAGLLSIFPRQIAPTWAERLAVPTMQHWAVYGILPLPLAFSLKTGPAFAAANGQFLLFTREAYDACGGHTTVKNDILEDVALARAVKRAAYKAILADGGPDVKTRMYTSPAEVWRGYSKNIYAFFGYSPFFLALGVAVLLALYVLPALFVLYALLIQLFTVELFYLPLAQYLAAVITRRLLASRFNSKPVDALLNPIAMLYLIAIAINSMLWSLQGKGTWKGRSHISPGC